LSQIHETDFNPNLFVIGVAKSGTTFLHDLLNEHPEINMSSVKEPHFFTSSNLIERSTTQKVSTSAEYNNLFETSGLYKYFGESSPSYAWDLTSLDRIKKLKVRPKIILILRDPLARAYSHYQMEIHSEREFNVSFVSAAIVDLARTDKKWGKTKLYVELSSYSAVLEKLQNNFNEEDYLILYYEEFFQNVTLHCNRISDFLGIKDFNPSLIPSTRKNKGIYSSLLMKYLKRVPGRYLIPAKIKNPLKKIINKKARTINNKETEFLLNCLKEDLLKQKELGFDYYLKYLPKRYPINL
jgi:hypothetical protein